MKVFSYSRTHIPLPDGAFIANGCAVDRSDYIGKTGYLCKLRFDVCLVYCIIRKPYIGYLGEMRMIPFKTAGMARLRALYIIYH